MKNIIALFATIFILIIASADLVVSKGLKGLQSRIIGGFQVKNHEYPYYAYLKVYSNTEGQLSQTQCGGTLIAKNVILVRFNLMSITLKYQIFFAQLLPDSCTLY